MLYCGVDRGEKHNCAVNIFDNDCIVQCIVELTTLTNMTKLTQFHYIVQLQCIVELTEVTKLTKLTRLRCIVELT